MNIEKPQIESSPSSVLPLPIHRTGGFSVITATFFIVGELAGGGLLSLPHAISLASWYGIPIIFFAAICGSIAGYYLAKSWMILEQHFPEYRHSLTRKPFATIGHYAYGKWMGIFVSILMNVTNTCATTVFILFTSDLLSQLTKSFIGYDICQWIPITSVIFLIPILFGSPIDFWPIAYGATLSTTIGSILLIISLAIQVKRHGTSNEFQIQNFENFSSCFGIAFYAFGGAAAFPSFQNDMRDKNQFSKAVIFGFLGLLLLYVPVATFGYTAFGIHSEANILNNFQSDSLLNIFITIVRCCFLVHFCTVIPITINPVFLDLEELLRIPKAFTWKRLLFRTFMLILMTFLAATFPNFGQILELIGGTTVTIMSFILPPLFYMKLCYEYSDDKNPNDKYQCPLWLKIVFGILIIMGTASGIASTFGTLSRWQPLESACYIAGHYKNQTNL
ncbi:hypothetical protein DERP_014620 [Dermatophagoides pteronyssinus]|uniref:Amino acid transporter transmembrane domain-containing protein n=1 Tax=Dermatophagoides pteronyssinus TaxID=6956 RepID=A0ABQ8IWA2_DERPT|nr:hypothetical protein DERP_014620 [Dermatophagoides pteronyssinus]